MIVFLLSDQDICIFFFFFIYRWDMWQENIVSFTNWNLQWHGKFDTNKSKDPVSSELPRLLFYDHSSCCHSFI